jgi:hypothetical protein
MKVRSSRIYLRGSHVPFLVVFSLLFMAALFLIAFVQTPGNSKFALLYPTVLLFLAAYYIDKASVSWIRISNDGKELVRVPSWFARKLLSEGRVVASIEPGAEFIICRRVGYGFVNGYSMILRDPDGNEKVVWDTSEPTMRHWLKRAADEITAKHKLTVRFVSRSTSDRGTEEKEWTGERERTKWRRVAIVLVPSMSPFFGIGVRYITANLEVIVIAGAGLWLFGCGCYFWLVRNVETVKGQSNAVILLIWTMQFIILYALSVIFTSHVIIPQWLGHTVR